MDPQMVINNEIVRLRKEVKRAKVHVIRKLMRCSHQLRGKNGSDEQVQKNKLRADRLVEEIDAMKKLKPDLVSKTALFSFTDFDVICRKGIVSAQDRAIARLSLFPPIRDKIKCMKDILRAFKAERENVGDAKASLVQEKPVEAETGSTAATSKVSWRKRQASRVQNERHAKFAKAQGNLAREPRRIESEVTAPNVSTMVEERPVQEEVSVDAKKKTSNRKTKAKLHKDKLLVENEHTAEEGQCQEYSFINVEKQKKAAVRREEAFKDTSYHQSVFIDKKEQKDNMRKIVCEDRPSREKNLEQQEKQTAQDDTRIGRVPEKSEAEAGLKVPKQDELGEVRPAAASEEKCKDEGREENDDKCDDSTEERFLQQLSSDNDDENDDFFLGKVKRLRKRRESEADSAGRTKKVQNKIRRNIQQHASNPGLAQLSLHGPHHSTRLTSAFCSRGSRGRTHRQDSSTDFALRGSRRCGTVKKNTPSWSERMESRHKGQTTGFGAERGSLRRPGSISRSTSEMTLHPSWEASRRRKEQQSCITVFQGKKTTFDD
uniref:Serum response factor-binding protein 1 n=1 Tax=Eptatretus burgeri TaxID=7764 RepID=A0A8C4QAQ2_EPTBU